MNSERAFNGLQKWFAFPVANPSFANITLLSMLGIGGLARSGVALVTIGLFTRARGRYSDDFN